LYYEYVGIFIFLARTFIYYFIHIFRLSELNKVQWSMTTSANFGTVFNVNFIKFSNVIQKFKQIFTLKRRSPK